MKLLKKIFLLTCVLASTLIIPIKSFADPTPVQISGSAAAGPLNQASLSLSGLIPDIIYSVTCSIAISGATTGSSNTVGAVGLYCVSGPGCEFKKPTLSNFGKVGPKNNIGTYQMSINDTGTTTLFDKAVQTVSTSNTLIFINLDSTATITASNCTATPVASSAIKKQ